MFYNNLGEFLGKGKAALARGPVALIFIEDLIEVESTIRHHQKAGFRTIVAFTPPSVVLAPDLAASVHEVRLNVHGDGAVVNTVNRLIDAAPGAWMFYCFNGEYLFHPFCETRTIGEFLGFHTEERRDSVLSYVIDLYASDLSAFPNAVDRGSALIDRSGYYALARKGEDGNPMDRQLDFFGGLRWRFEEHIAPTRRKIDRITLFRSKPGLRLLPNHTFSDEEYNTYACPWHNNMTVALASFRAAKALRTNPGSAPQIRSFRWHNSIPFEWHSQQLMDLGLMEPGQWF